MLEWEWSHVCLFELGCLDSLYRLVEVDMVSAAASMLICWQLQRAGNKDIKNTMIDLPYGTLTIGIVPKREERKLAVIWIVKKWDLKLFVHWNDFPLRTHILHQEIRNNVFSICLTFNENKRSSFLTTKLYKLIISACLNSFGEPVTTYSSASSSRSFRKTIIASRYPQKSISKGVFVLHASTIAWTVTRCSINRAYM